MKRELRERARAVLLTISEAERQRRGEAIAARIWQVEELARARTILVYAAVPHEVPTASVVSEAERRGISVLYPRCLADRPELALHQVTRPDELVPGRFGIPEPLASCPEIPDGQVDAALVPGLLWDRHGARLGRGAGYYDRLLTRSGWRGFTCGLFFSEQEVQRLPTDPWDAHLDVIVTEREVWRTARGEQAAGSLPRNEA
jgi:5-formyltetrahydrofolate cyclo-ligase